MKHDPVALRALADRVEALVGPDRDVHGLVAVASGEYVADRHRSGMFYKVGEQISGYGVPAFTASLDAAMSLVPEGWWVSWLTIGCPHSGNSCIIGTICGRAVSAEAATPALALCAAALRALAHHSEDKGAGDVSD
jgi:hypothetical protein